MKIKALKDYQWKVDDSFSYVAGNLYDETESRALEMIEHGYAQEFKKYEEVLTDQKRFKEDKKETKVVNSEENKKSKKAQQI